MASVFLALGSNLGDRAANIEAALRGLDSLPGTRLVAWTDPIETAPVGGPPNQGMYLNAACQVESDSTPESLLEQILRLERDIGRTRGDGEVRWGPRVIDIDIVLWEGVTVASPRLTIPHPRLAEREFVLEPLYRLDPELRHPETGLTVRELLERIRNKQ